MRDRAGHAGGHRAAFVAVLAAVATILPTGAASPARGTLVTPRDPSPDGQRPKQTIEYAGASLVAGAMGGVEEARRCDPAVCDSFKLTVAIPDSFWIEYRGLVQVLVSWGQASADLDLYVFDGPGRLIGSSARSNTTSPIELLDLVDLPHGTYSVNALNRDPVELAGYTGSISLFVFDGPFPRAPNTVTSASLRFAPATRVGPSAIGGEPGINFDRRRRDGGRIYVDWPTGDPLGQRGALYRSTDGGDSFRAMEGLPCAAQGFHTPSCFQSGGTDTDTALSPASDLVYFADQEIGTSASGPLNEALAASPDGGTSWPPDRQHAITNAVVGPDRQWLAARLDARGEVAYLSYQSGSLGQYVHTILDGGRIVVPQPAPQVLFVQQAGPLAVDNTGGPNDGAIYFPFVNGDGRLAVAVSSDDAQTFSQYVISPPGHSLCRVRAPSVCHMPWLALDEAGNAFVTYLETSSSDAYVSTMKAGAPANAARPGSAWSRPGRVSAPPAHTTVFPGLTAASAGRLAVAYYGTDSPGLPDDVRPDARWFPYIAMSGNALCQWDVKPCAAPRFEQAVVARRANHIGSVCSKGGGCSVPAGEDRSLLDFLDIGYDEAGRIGVAWTDDNTDLDRNEVSDPSGPTAIRDFNGLILYAGLSQGPSLRSGRPAIAIPERVAGFDRRGDATWPLNGPFAPGPVRGSLDLVATRMQRVGPDLVVEMQLSDASDLGAGLVGTGDYRPDGSTVDAVRALYLTTWYHGDNLYFAAAEFAPPGDPAIGYYSGRIEAKRDPADQTSDSDRLTVFYRSDHGARGSIAGNRIRISVPLANVGSPRPGDRLVSVSGFALTSSASRTADATTAPHLIDAAPPFDHVLPRFVAPPPLAPTGVGRAQWVAGGLLLLLGAIAGRRLRHS